jgi:cbb3-type cytochrome oxidase subunit 1
MNLAQWEKSIVLSMPFWHIRTLAGTAIVAGFMLYGYNLWMTARTPSPRTAESGPASGKRPGDQTEEAPSAAS